jgi:hypothetical protein
MSVDPNCVQKTQLHFKHFILWSYRTAKFNVVSFAVTLILVNSNLQFFSVIFHKLCRD